MCFKSLFIIVKFYFLAKVRNKNNQITFYEKIFFHKKTQPERLFQNVEK